MSDTITITVLGTPVGKGRARSTASGHHYTPTKTRNYEMMLRYAAQQEMGNRPPMNCAVEMSLRVVVPIPASWSEKKKQAARSGAIRPISKPDLSNFQKAVEDGFNAVIYHDDSQIVQYSALDKVYGDKPGIFTTVRPLL